MHDDCPSGGYPRPPACGCNAPQAPQAQATGGGYNPFPRPNPPLPRPGIPGGLMDLAADLAGEAEKRLCSKWTTDGFSDFKTCCTPRVSRGGYGISACIQISRPHDPFAGTEQGGGGIIPG